MFLLRTAALGQSEEVSECGAFLNDRRGHLAADLTCLGTGFAAVGMDGQAELDLRGHTLTSDRVGVACAGVCAIVSSVPGGRIMGTGAGARAAIDTRWGASVEIKNTILTGFNIGIIDTPQATLVDSVIENMAYRGTENTWVVRLTRSAVRNNNGTGLYECTSLTAIDSDISNNAGHAYDSFFGRVRLTRSTIVDNGGNGLGCDTSCDVYPLNGVRSVKAVDSEISRNGGAGIDVDVEQGKVQLIGTTVADNGASGARLLGGSLRAKASQITGNGAAGVEILNNAPEQLCKILVLDSTITSNARHGMECTSNNRARMTVQRSSVTVNGTDAACGLSVPCADLAATEEPRLAGGAACGASYVAGSGIPGQSWGICTND